MSSFASGLPDAVLAITRTDAFASCDRWRRTKKTALRPEPGKVAVFVDVVVCKTLYMQDFSRGEQFYSSTFYGTGILIAFKYGAENHSRGMDVGGEVTAMPCTRIRSPNKDHDNVGFGTNPAFICFGDYPYG